MGEVDDDKMPVIGMEFTDVNLAYDFYNEYAGSTGFSMRFDYRNFCRKDKTLVTNCRFVCCKAGFRKPDKRDYMYKNPRAEVRVGCLAKMGIRLNRASGKYNVYDFHKEHNHELAPPNTRHMLKSQRKVPDAHAEQIVNAADSGIQLGASFELLSREAGGRDALSFLKIDQKNYLRTKRLKELEDGEHGRVLKYLQDKALEDPSFFYAFQLDSENYITNIFWADAQMRIDYGLFGDVLSFDTTYKINDSHRPCAAFVGFNHHRMSTVFGVALMYDETTDSFRWLMDIFLAAMNNIHPRSIFTDQDKAMANAISECMPHTFHGLCIWHLTQNALKHVPHREVDGRGVHSILSHFYYDVETEEDFEALWDMMVDNYKLQDNNWVNATYTCRRKWAFVYIKDQWTAMIRSTQLSESFNSKLKKFLKSEYNLPQFFHHFDRILDDIRYKELQAEFSLSQTCPRVKGPVRMLKAASETYTKTIFEEFQEEYYMSLECIITGQSVVGNGDRVEFTVKYENEERKVIKDNEGRLSCSCKLFERQGLLCSHALKVLRDVLNILQLPEEYILRRWTRKARALGIADSFIPHVKPDCKIHRTSRMRDLFTTYNRILTRASDCLESYEVAVRTAYDLSKHVEEIIANKQAGNNSNDDIINNLPEVDKEDGNTNVKESVKVKGLKPKKDPHPKRKKRFVGPLERTLKKAKRIWNEKKKNQNLINDSSPRASNIEQQTLNEVHVYHEQPQVLKNVDNNNNPVSTEALISMCDSGGSFTELLQSAGVTDFENIRFQNLESQASNTSWPEYHHFK